MTRTLLSVLQHSAVNGGTFEMFAKALDEARNIEDAHRAGAYYFAEIAKREYNSSAGHLGFSQQMKIQQAIEPCEDYREGVAKNTVETA